MHDKRHCRPLKMFAARGVTLENGHVYNSVMNAAKYQESKNAESNDT